MADRYWVGGTGSWNGTAGTKWATTSGGPGGAAEPTSADDVYFDAASGAVTVTAFFTRLCRNINFTGFTGTFAGTTILRVYGSIKLVGTVTWTFSGDIYLDATTTGQTIDTQGVLLNSVILAGASGAVGEWRLLSNFTTQKSFTLSNGTFDADVYNVSFTLLSLTAGTKALKLGTGVWTCSTSPWNASTNATGLTVTPGTATISMTSASSKTFSGGNFTWPTLNQGGAGALIIANSNTFANITNTVQPATITLTSGTTQTVTDFDVSGTSGNLITLNASTPGSRATLTDSGGINSVSFVDIKDIAATGYGEWQAYTSNGNVNSGNNVGWVFDAPPAFVASEYPPELRSFTEKRRF